MRRMTSTAIKQYGLAGMALLLCGTAQSEQPEQLCPPALERTTPDSRLQDNGDGTVTDLATELMWKQCSEGQEDDSSCSGDAATLTWEEALQWPDDFNTSGGGFAGHADWRLPNSKELQSIVEQGCRGPSINVSRFPNADHALRTWTASASVNDTQAITVQFLQGVVAPELRANRANAQVGSKRNRRGLAGAALNVRLSQSVFYRACIGGKLIKSPVPKFYLMYLTPQSFLHCF